MAAAEQACRAELHAAGVPDEDAALDPRLRALRERHGARLWDLLDDLEAWPGVRLVGPDGSEAAWRVAQHAILDPELQRRCLAALDLAVDLGDASPVHRALLHDRVRMSEGRAQLYGSQVVRARDGRGLEPWPVDDVELVDRRRAALGLPPLAEHLRRLRRGDPGG